MAHQVGDIVQATYLQTCNAQTLMTTQHMRVISGTSQSSDLADNANFAGYLSTLVAPNQLIGMWASIMGDNWNLIRIRGQKISPTRTTYHDEPMNVLGGNDGPCATQNIAAVVTKRGAGGGRRALGSIHFGGFHPSAFVNGDISNLIVGWWESLEPLWMASFTVPINNVVYKPVIYNPGATPNFNDIVEMNIHDEARIMNRRTVGHGI